MDQFILNISSMRAALARIGHEASVDDNTYDENKRAHRRAHFEIAKHDMPLTGRPCFYMGWLISRQACRAVMLIRIYWGKQTIIPFIFADSSAIWCWPPAILAVSTMPRRVARPKIAMSSAHATAMRRPCCRSPDDREASDKMASKREASAWSANITSRRPALESTRLSSIRRSTSAAAPAINAVKDQRQYNACRRVRRYSIRPGAISTATVYSMPDMT